eukprot:gene13136-3928_t
MESIKILVCGDVKGQFAKIFKKVGNLNKKNGPFEVVLCPGQFFAASDQCEKEWKECITGSIKAPLPFYILGPTIPEFESFYTQVSLEDGGELCHNITYLGKKGVYTTVSGLQIAYVGGKPGGVGSKSVTKIQNSDIDALLKKPKEDDKFTGIDILMTSAWPKDVQKYTNFDVDVSDSSKLVSIAASVLKPRYHFTCHEDYHMERTPYRNHQVLQGKQEHVTRFICLAPFLNKDNKKFLYAFNICPMSKMSREELVKQPADSTEFPFKKILHEMEQTDSESKPSQQQFFYDQKKLDESKKRKNAALTGPCWFCLGSPQVEKHLVISVGLQTYLALAKGGLTENHVLICPIHHYNSTVVLPEETLMEIEKYPLIQVSRYVVHIVVPIHLEKVEEAKSAFKEYGQLQSLEFADVPEDKDLQEMVSVTTPYFAVEFDDGDRLLHRVRSKMPLQFGREVLASSELLDLPEKVDWKNCKLSKEEETRITKNFRVRFTPFDFNS